ncbi:MAG: gephyrin-like molybdotransferase Glp [Gammaproteobacteria bacterium]|jgi:molybdopterin molybdotransferase|nr:gephyrin-like molybdotransferase Glp [Gammaproteobacteria bacterium]
MISYPDALATVREVATPLAPVTVNVRYAAGRVSAAVTEGLHPVPPFDNSAMDGFALRSADTAAASPANPVVLAVTDLLTAGENASQFSVTAGGSCEIMTGAPLPRGADTVVPVEQVELQRDAAGKPTAIVLRAPAEPDRNLRRAGEDFAAAAPLLQPGNLLTPADVMGLAATGREEIRVYPAPRIAAITTGNELSDSAGLEPGMIHDANGPYLAAMLPAFGADFAGLFRSGDRAGQLIDRITALPDVDMIVTTGGVSAGRLDFVPAVLEQMGADILFHKVALRPGKPLLFARLADGRLVFALPGNPIAVAVGMRFFVLPAMRALQHQPAETFASAQLSATVGKKPGLTFFAKARAALDDDGSYRVTVLPGQESFKIRPLMAANCWAILPAAAAEVPAGTAVQIAPLAGPHWSL